MINPVTGRRYAKSWNIDELLSHAPERYARIGNLLGKEYLSPVSIYQVLADARVEEIWMLRAADPEFQPYLDKEIITLSSPGLRNLRCAEIHRAFHLQVSALIHDSAKWFAKQKILIQEVFEPKAMQVLSNGITYKGHNYDHIIFCEGHRVLRNSLFSNLEIYPMKGEYLICRIPGLVLTQHIKFGISLIPLPEMDVYWCGATYDRYNQNPSPTDAGRSYILNHLKEIVHIPFTVAHHGVGIRATTRDRRPYVGTHPDYPRVHAIAGLGTKGASLAPYCAMAITEYLDNGKIIPDEVQILRHSG